MPIDAGDQTLPHPAAALTPKRAHLHTGASGHPHTEFSQLQTAMTTELTAVNGAKKIANGNGNVDGSEHVDEHEHEENEDVEEDAGHEGTGAGGT